MKNKYTIAYIGAIIALPVALLFIVPAVATTNAFDWNGGSTAQSSFADAEANALGTANTWTWNTGTNAGAQAETESDASAHALALGDGAEAEADADTEGYAWSSTGTNDAGVTSGEAYAWNTGSASASAHVHTSTCGHDYDEAEDEDHDYEWCDDHDCTPECTTGCDTDYDWCDDHDCDDHHECTWGCEEEETPAPTCTLDIFPGSIVEGDEAVLYWQTSDATSVTISGGIGAASLDGEEAIYPHTSQTYTLTAVGAGGTAVCSDSVGVIADEDGQVIVSTTTTVTNVNNNYAATTTLTNVNNNYNYNSYSSGSSNNNHSNNNNDDVSCDSFTVSDSRVEEGDEVTLRWKTSDADDVDINQGVGDVDDDGSETVTVKKDTTFTLTARDGSDKDTCRVSVTVDEDEDDDNNDNDKLRCEFSVSDTAIRTGESVILSWVNDAADRLVLKDNNGKTLADSKKDKDIDEDVDVLTVKPAKTTKYTLDVYDGNKKETCVLNVEVGKGTVSGISLSQVPYTGFEAGPMLTAIFYGAIVLWGLVLAYALVLKKKHSRILSK